MSTADAITVFCDGVRIGAALALIIGTPVFLFTLLVLQLRESRQQYRQASLARPDSPGRATERTSTPGAWRAGSGLPIHRNHVGAPGVGALNHNNHRSTT